MSGKKLVYFCALGFMTITGSVQADRIVFTDQERNNNWNSANNWIYYKSNPVRTGIPSDEDEARLEPGKMLKITTTVTVGYLKVGVNGPGTVLIDGGSLVAVGTIDYNSANYNSTGSIIIQNGGSATFNSRFMVGNNNFAGGELILHEGTVRVANVYFHNKDYSGTEVLRTRTTINAGGSLDVNELVLNSGTMDIAGGTVIVRQDAVYAVERWVAEGRIIAMGGAAGWKIKVTFDSSTGWTTIVAEPAPGPIIVGKLCPVNPVPFESAS